MWKIETYIAPLFMSYVDKYIKNLKPSDLSLSLWGGDVVLYNLDLRLDVLEKELRLPVSFLSGKIHKLQIHVPWTSLGSEPVEVTISTIECVVQLRDPAFSAEDIDSSTSVESEVSTQPAQVEDIKTKGEPPPSGYVQNLLNRVINNVSICVNNVILKYVEDDIVLSLNLKSVEMFSVNSKWEKSFVDVAAPDFLLKKVCNISDLTICLDKRNSSGQIEMYQDPLVYRCCLNCRILISYDQHLQPISTKVNVYCECLEISLTDQQLSLFIRLLKLCILLYYGTLDLPGCNFKPHPAAQIVHQRNLKRAGGLVSLGQSNDQNLTSLVQEDLAAQQDWSNWMWSFVPTLVDEGQAQRDESAPECSPPGHLMTLGLYITQVTVSVKLTEKISEGLFFGAQRFEFKPMMNMELSGTAVEITMRGEDFFDAQLGVTSIMGWNIGDCVCTQLANQHSRVKSEEEVIETLDEKEEIFLKIGSSLGSHPDPSGFLRGSLFDDGSHSTFELPEVVFEANSFLEGHSEEHALKRFGAFFFDYLYTMEIEASKSMDDVEDQAAAIEDVNKITLVREVSHKRLLLAGTQLHLSTSLLHRLESIYKYSFDDLPPRKEKTTVFYDEFIEKQLLAGNISSRHFNITLLSVLVTIPAADHQKPQPTQQRSSDVTLQSIQEQEQATEVGPQVDCVIQADRLELQRTSPMYPSEITKLIVANVDYPAGQNMLQQAYNRSVLKAFNVQAGLSQPNQDNQVSSLLNIVPAFSSALVFNDCILPTNWGQSYMVRHEARLEIPLMSLRMTKPQMLLVKCFITTWIRCVSQIEKIPEIPMAVITGVFHNNETGSEFCQPLLEVSVSDIDLQLCDTSAVVGISGSVGTLQAQMHSQAEGLIERTVLLYGPTDTSALYSDQVFKSHSYGENPVETVTPVLSFTIQVPNVWRAPVADAIQGPSSMEYGGGIILFQLKGIAVSLDSLLYSWISYNPSGIVTSTGSERRGTTRHKTLTRTGSVTTPKKKSFARGYGSVASPSKGKSGQAKSDEKTSKQMSSEQPAHQEKLGQSLESWLYNQLPVVTSLALQGDIRNFVVFMPESHIPNVSKARSIPNSYSILYSGAGPLPSSLVLCLPSINLNSASQKPVAVRQELPLKLPQPLQRETLPWTLTAANFSVYSIHRRSKQYLGDKEKYFTSVHYILSPVSSTAVLASAKTTSTATSPKLLTPQISRQFTIGGGVSGRRAPVLGFCIHTDFKPIVVSCSTKQVKLVCSLAQNVTACIIEAMSISSNVTNSSTHAMDSVPPTPIAACKRVTSVTSSSAADQMEVESTSELSDSLSTVSFMQVHQPQNQVVVSLWLQWTLPRFVVKLYGKQLRESSALTSQVCVSAELEDLTASIDYKDMHLQMQYKLGAFNITHSFKGDCGSWNPGRFNGVLVSCSDIISLKSPFLKLSRVTRPDTTSGSGPRGFLTVMYKRSSLHLKRRKTSSEKTSKESLEDCIKDQHEIRISMEPVDIVLWTPIVVSSFEVFDPLITLILNSFLHNQSMETKNIASQYSRTEASPKASSACNVVSNADLLPLIFLNMRDLRVFVPRDKDLESGFQSNKGRRETAFQDDMMLLHLQTVNALPHPDNPNSRLVLQQKLFEEFRKFGRGTRQALGYDINEVQYQLDVGGFAIWSGSWEELCGNSNKSSEGDDGIPLMDQNPALEWNTQLRRGKNHFHITPVVVSTDFRLVVAPPIKLHSVTGSSGSITLCGCSLELNILADVECYLNKGQIHLLQTIAMENINAISSGILSKFVNTSSKSHDVTTGNQLPCEKLDSGFESLQTKQLRKLEGTKGDCDFYEAASSKVPIEVLLTGRKVLARIYMQGKPKPSDEIEDTSRIPRVKHQTKREMSRILPILEVEVLHPAVVVNTSSLAPKIQLTCLDITMTGTDPEQDTVARPIPEAVDFKAVWLKSGPGRPDVHSGISPSLLTVDVLNFLHGPVDINIDLGRPLFIQSGLHMIEHIINLVDDLLPTTCAAGSKQTSCNKSQGSLLLGNLGFSSSEATVEFDVYPHEDNPKLMVSFYCMKIHTNLNPADKVAGGTERVVAGFEMDGLTLRTSLKGKYRTLVSPCCFSSDIEMIWSPHSLDYSCHSGSGSPHLYVWFDMGFLQVNFGQEHLQCLTCLSASLNEFMSLTATNSKSAKTDENYKVPADATEAMKYSIDDIRAGPFTYVKATGLSNTQHPKPYEIVFSADSNERPPSMTWRYSEPRALTAFEVLPLPLSSPILVNTLNMGDEYQVPCMLRYWDNLQKCYVTYRSFFLSETSPSMLSFPDPVTSNPAEVMVAEEWQIVIDVARDNEYQDELSQDEDETASTYSAVYHSLISATSLAASVKVNSVFSPQFIPALCMRGSVGIIEVRLVNHMRNTDRVLAKRLQGYTVDSSIPTEQELMLLTVEGLSGLTKHIGGKGSFSLLQLEFNCHLDIINFGDLTYHSLLSPFDMALTAAMFHDIQEISTKATSSSRSIPPLWLDAAVDIQQVQMYVRQSTVHTVSMATIAWQQEAKETAEDVILNHYIICNDTHEVLRFGQVKTDESLVLGNRQVYPYSWRTPRSPALEPRLQVCIETEGDWRWSEPVDIDIVGVCSRTIHHRLHSATLFIEVKPLNGVQKQVVIRGSHTFVSHLSIDVEVQILKKPSLSQPSQPEAVPFQVLESVQLPSGKTLPSYIVPHGGLAGMRIRIPNCTTWSDLLPLDNGEQAQQEKIQHQVVRLLSVKEFQMFYMWYSVERNVTTDQVRVSLSPLFIVRSHLAESVLMNVVTANSNETTIIPASGRGHEQQIFNLGPNAWHHVTFQFGEGGRMSNPSVPLNTTLIELANRMKAEDDGGEDESVGSLWPYCGLSQPARNEDDKISLPAESALLRNVTSPAKKLNESSQIQATPEAFTGRPAAIPDIELQCRVVKRWPVLSTLVIDVIPWCLIVNKTSSDLYIRDINRDVVLNIPRLEVVAPHKFQGDVQFGTPSINGLDICWSESVPLPSELTSSSQQGQQTAEDKGLPVTVAFVRESGKACARQLSVCSSYRRGIHVLCAEDQYVIVNKMDRQLAVYPVLVIPDKKIVPCASRSFTSLSLPKSSSIPVPIGLWDVPTTSSLVLDGDGNAVLGDTRTVLFLAFADQHLSAPKGRHWSRAVHITSELPRQMVAVPITEGKSTHAVVVATEVVSGVVHVVVASDPSPRLMLFNNCPFTLQFGQAIPPQSPTYVPGSTEKIVVLEQTDPYRDVPKVHPLSSTHYELPVMREWFSTASQVQQLPPLQFQAMYNVGITEIAGPAEDGFFEESVTEVPQGWSQTVNIDKPGEYRVNVPGRGQLRVVVSRHGLCSRLYIDPSTLSKPTLATNPQGLFCKSQPTFEVEASVIRFGVVVIDEVSTTGCPVELLRLTVDGVEFSHSVVGKTVEHSQEYTVASHNDVKVSINSVQLDNQLVDDLYEFAVVLMPTDPLLRLSSRKRQRRSSVRKHLLLFQCAYETSVSSNIFIHSMNVIVDPLTVFIEDTLLYRLADALGSFAPSLSSSSTPRIPAINERTDDVLLRTSSVINPLVIGWFRIEAVSLRVTCHGSVKLFVAVDETPLSLAPFEFAPVYTTPSVLIQRLLYHYATSALFKAGWVLGSLELLGNPAGLVRSVGQGVSDLFYLPYDGLTRGPGAFVTGMTRGMSSLIRHLSTGTLTSITHLASSMSRNMDRLCMDETYRRMQEEQRCSREPKKVFTGFAQGLSGFGLSLLGAVAGIVDQPIQGIQRAADAREVASSVITGVGKGLLGVVTKPIGGAMELVSQTGQGILEGTGLSKLPERLFPVGESLSLCSKNSQLKYSWKILRLTSQQAGAELQASVEATIVSSSGNEYEGAILVSSDTLYVVSLAGDTVQQSVCIRDIEFFEDEQDTRGLVLVVNQHNVSTKDEKESLESRPDTGDPERLKQFLRDAQALSTNFLTPSEGGSDLGIPSGIQRFLILVDPVLRHLLALQVNTLKAKMTSATENGE